MSDYVHMMISIPPKIAVSNAVGYIRGRAPIDISWNFRERRRNFVGQNFWARGYFVSTVGREEKVIRDNIRHEEKEDIRQDRLLFE